MKWSLPVVLAFPALLCSCAGMIPVPRVDPAIYVKDPVEKIEIPPACKKAYESATPRIAVSNMTNNTSFDYAKTVESHVSGERKRASAGAVGVVVAPGAAAVGWTQAERTKFKKDSVRVEKEVNAKLAESVEDGVTNELVNLGGAKVYTRSELKKVIEEQKFQQSGLADETTLVKLGKVAGVKYMVTGSVDNVNLRYLDLEESKKLIQDSPLGNLVKDLLTNAVEGWNVETEVTLRMIDVESGELIISKKVIGRNTLGKMPYPNYDALVGGIKKAVSRSLADLRPEFSKILTVKGYVIQSKTSPDGREKIVLINAGEAQGVKAGARFFAYTFEEVQDPMTGNLSCDQQRLPIEITVTDQVQKDKAWCVISCDPAYHKFIKPGQLVERAPVRK